MPKMKMDRDFTIRSTVGHTLGFKAGKEMAVPPVLVNECLKYGAVYCEGEKAPKQCKSKKSSPDGDDRVAAVANAMESIFVRNDREDFTGSGSPDLKALSLEAGFKVDVKERDKAWEEFTKDKNVEPSNV